MIILRVTNVIDIEERITKNNVLVTVTFLSKSTGTLFDEKVTVKTTLMIISGC